MNNLAFRNAHFLCSASCEWAAVGGRNGLDAGDKDTFPFKLTANAGDLDR